MGEGLQVWGSDGRIQIDSNFLTYGLVASGYIQEFKPQSTRWTWDKYGFHVNNCVAPVVFIEGGATYYSTMRSGSNWTFYYHPVFTIPYDPDRYRTGWPAGMPARSESPRYYVFDYMTSNKSRSGLEVFNPQGKTIFNSDQWPLNIVATTEPPPVQTASKHHPPYARISGWTYNFNPPSNHGTTAARSLSSIGLDSGRRYACNMPWRRGASAYGGGDNYSVIECVITSGGWLGYTWQVDPFTPFELSDYDHYAVYNVHLNRVTSTIIDVTDLPFPFTY